MIDTGLPITVEVGTGDVTINDKVKLLRPRGVSTSQWQDFWERLDKDHTNDKDGYVVVDLA